MAHYRPSKDVYNELKKKYPQIAKYEDCTIDDAIWARVVDQASRGHDNAINFISERTEGKVKDRVDITSGDEKIEQAPAIDLSKLTPDKIAALRGVLRDVIRPTNT
jgi:hypothetical protein